jgi:hypothetical protein
VLAKIPGPALQLAGEMTEVVDPVGDQVVHVAIGFQHAVDGQDLRPENFCTLPFK